MTLPLRTTLNRSLLVLAGLGAIAYTGTCFYLHVNQRKFLYSPRRDFHRQPDHPELNLPYQERFIPVNPSEKLHAWWIPAPTRELSDPVPNEPQRIFGNQPKTLLYFYGRGGNKSSTGLYRAEALHQLGFEILMIDYRGFGASDGDAPSEATMYEDSEAAWNYLVSDRRIPPDNIVIYGESMGGAVAINLAKHHPEAHALIAQSTFTSMTRAISLNPFLRMLPMDWILTDTFNSIAKISSIQMPVLFLHGIDDVIVSSLMSEQLYAAAPEPKTLHLVPGAGHFNIYKPGDDSYLGAIARFLTPNTTARTLANTQPPNSQPRAPISTAHRSPRPTYLGSVSSIGRGRI